jgi:hypothetical protein
MVNQQRGQQRGPAPRFGRANYTTMEEIPTGEVLASTFFLNERPIIILFDSGASHDSMSSTCSQKARLSMVAMEVPYVISTPRGQVDANRIVRKVPLELLGWVFNTYFIILSGHGLDVILGMKWMKLHKAVLSHLVLKPKLNAHSTCAQESSFHTNHTENGYRITNVTIYNIYYTNNVLNKILESNTLKTHQQKDTITPQAIDRW